MSNDDVSTSRRDILKGLGIVTMAAAGYSMDTLAESKDHTHMHHAQANDPELQRIIDNTMDCLKKGEACSQHCIDLFKAGDTSVANCADSVQEMLAACTALSKLATYNSKHLKVFVTACVGVCEDCEKECRKHADKHTACKACADSCIDCIKACKDYLA